MKGWRVFSVKGTACDLVVSLSSSGTNLSTTVEIGIVVLYKAENIISRAIVTAISTPKKLGTNSDLYIATAYLSDIDAM